MAECKEVILNKSEADEVPGKQCEAVPGRSDCILCQPCLKRNSRMTADFFCKTCGEFQCTGCTNVHKDFSFMENHELVEVQEVVSTPRFCDMKGLDKCDKHRKVLEFFCEDEKLLCCSSCAIVEHRKCHSVVEIQRISRNTSLYDSNVRIKLQDKKAKAELIVTQTHGAEESLDQDIKEISLKIKRMREDVIKIFDDLEVYVAETSAVFKTETIEKLASKQTTCKKYVDEVTQLLGTIDHVYQNGTQSQQFIVEHRLKNQVNVLEQEVEETCLDLETVTVSFDFDERLILPPLSITDYIPGTLTLKYNKADPVKSIGNEDPIMSLENITSVDLKQTGDDYGEPLYTGLDFLPDGRLVAVDNENKSCSIFNKKLEKVGSYQLSYRPQSMVAVSEEEVAITSTNMYKIDFLRVSKSNEITLIRTCKVITQYDSICMKDDENFIVGTIDDTRSVRVVSLSGEEKDFSINFPNKKYPFGTSACTYIRNSAKVVLTDTDEHTVYIYNIATNTRLVVKDEQIKTPRGVAVGPSDCILVCSKGTDSIVQISQTGQVLSSYKLDAGLPFRVCVSQNKSILAVTTNWKGNRKLQLFKITQYRTSMQTDS